MNRKGTRRLMLVRNHGRLFQVTGWGYGWCLGIYNASDLVDTRINTDWDDSGEFRYRYYKARPANRWHVVHLRTASIVWRFPTPGYARGFVLKALSWDWSFDRWADMPSTTRGNVERLAQFLALKHCGHTLVMPDGRRLRIES